MESLDGEHEELVSEVLDALTEKFKKLPVVNRNILAIATVEAAAMIVATEVNMHAKILGYDKEDAMGRIQEYTSLLFRNAGMAYEDLQE